MVTALFVAACLFAVIFRNKKRAREREGRAKGLSYSCLKISLEFLIPLICVILFYYLLLLSARVASEFASIQFLIQLEEALARIKSFIALLELNPWETLFVFAALYLLGLLRAFAKASAKLRRFFEHYQTALRRVYIFIVLLCSFTLLGSELGAPSNHLKLRINTIREGYAALHQEVEAALKEEIADRLYAQALDSLPPPYREAVAQADTVSNLMQGVREEYTKAQKESNVKIPPILILVETYSAREKKIETAEQALRNINESAKRPATRPPEISPQTSYRDLKQAKAALEEHRKKFSSRGIRFLQRNGAKQLLGQLPSVMTDRLRASMRSLLASTPLGEAVTEFIFSAVEDYSQVRIDEAVDKITKSLSESPRDVNKALENEAVRLVNSTPAKATRSMVEKANREIKRWQVDFEKIRKANTVIAQEVQRVESAKLDKFISRLSSANEQTRAQAVAELSRKGTKLNKRQVNRLVEIMRTGEGSWTNYLSREGHCTWYEEVSVRHYAADALRNMSSPHVNEAIASEARSVASRGKSRFKVTDPGWI